MNRFFGRWKVPGGFKLPTIGLALLLVGLQVWLGLHALTAVWKAAPATIKVVLCLVHLASALALLGAAMANRGWCIAGILFFLGGFLIESSFLRIKGRAMTLWDAQVLREAMGNAMDVLRQYPLEILVSCTLLAGVSGLLYAFRRSTSYRSNQTLGWSFASVSLTYFLLLGSGRGHFVNGFPGTFFPGLGIACLAADPWVTYFRKGPAIPISFKAVRKDIRIQHVVLVIDESIEGDTFGQVASLLEGGTLINLERGFSNSNCSSGSNLMLRRSVDPMDMDHSLQVSPSLFELAKRNGFHTTYWDAQGVLEDGAVQDFFDRREISFIDQVFPMNTFGPLFERDLRVAQSLPQVIGTHPLSFSIVNKVGCHFPFVQNLPSEMQAVPDPYRATLIRSSIGFLNQLRKGLPPGTVVFYTSDHGQNFKGRTFHCNFPGECAPSEWFVPILVMASPDLSEILGGIDTRWIGGASHAVLTESVLRCLGVRNPALASLWDAREASPTTFHRAFYGSPKKLFGRQAPYLNLDTRTGTFVP